MQIPRIRTALLALGSLPAAAGIMLDCANILVDKQHFDLSSLGGPHSVVTHAFHDPSHVNTTYTLDICRNLVKKGDACPNGTRVCGIRHVINPGDGPGHGDVISEIRPIAGELAEKGGHAFEFDVSLLHASGSHEDAEKKGLRLILKGGAYPLDGPKDEKKDQQTIIEFQCSEKTGLEGEWTPEDKYEKGDKLRREEGEKKDDGENKKEGEDDGKGKEGEPHESGKEEQFVKEDTALKFVSYGTESGNDHLEILRLTWETKAACQSVEGGGGSDEPSQHWGFFTWLVIIAFLGIAAYLIFGSWLNYNRYGARGWDLLPHGDTIRDVPYLMKDWTRRVLNTVQGTGSRGGYSAV